MVRRNSEDGFEDAVADDAGKHPVQSDECHGAIGVIDDDVRMDSIEHFTEVDEGKESEKDGREVGNHVHGEVTLNACMIVEENDTDNESNDKPDGILFEITSLKGMVFAAEESHVVKYQ